MADNQFSEEDQQHIQDELVRLSTLLDRTVAQLKDEFKRRDEEKKAAADERNQMFDNLTRKIIAQVPMRVCLLPDSATPEFQLCLGKVDDWVLNNIGQDLPGGDNLQRVLETAKKEPRYGAVFRKALEDDPRLRLAAHAPSLETRIVETSIYFWLTREVYGNGLQRVSPASFQLLQDLEQFMGEDKFPGVALQGWKAQTYHAWINTSRYQADREKYTLDMAKELATGMAMLLPDLGDLDTWVGSLRTEIIEPNLELKEQMMASNLEFEVTTTQDVDDHVTKSQLDFKWEEYLDITSHHRHLNAKNMDDTKPIRMLGVLRPFLSSVGLRDDRNWYEPEVCVKQERLVAWKEDFDKFISGQQENEVVFWSQFIRETMDETPDFLARGVGNTYAIDGILLSFRTRPTKANE
ncbi:uncharacterized protein PG986_001205 [Apiospora aurea]|uniref:Uncharacterized protein n=1 Tax=Apiospora aurea TaxID=335848 RepID=A0ABR1QWA8_9PEZI